MTCASSFIVNSICILSFGFTRHLNNQVLVFVNKDFQQAYGIVKNIFDNIIMLMIRKQQNNINKYFIYSSFHKIQHLIE